MSESGTVSADKPGKRQDNQKNELGLFARIALFIRQVVAELRKVVTPTRSELVNYTIVVSNNGPLAATNVLLTDTAGAGQDCTTPSTTATCTATGGASCPSPTVPVSASLSLTRSPS